MGLKLLMINQEFCTQCGTQFSSTNFKQNPNGRSFIYSKKFYVVLGVDVLLSFFITIGGTGSYFDITNQGYHNPTFLFLVPISLVNLILDGIILSNKRKNPNLIDIRLCWLKCLFGCLGIFTILSFLYFGIIGFAMRNDNKIKIDKKMGNTLMKSPVDTSCSEVLNQNSPYSTECKTIYPINEEEKKRKEDESRIDEIIRRNEEET